MPNQFFYRFGPVEYDFSYRTHVVGVLNVTPDSFSDGGKFFDKSGAIEHALRMTEEGADIIDIGGESTRPGSDSISADEELRRVIPVIEALSGKVSVPISIDTYKSAVARRAIEAGATIVNDISGLTFDPEMPAVAAQYKATVVIMHMKGTPKTMQADPVYDDVVGEIKQFLFQQAQVAEAHGVEQIILDPGIGFGKRLEHNLEVFRRLRELTELDYPVMVGPSRKSFIGMILDVPVDSRLEGTAAATAVSILNGANLIRVHDVKAMKRVAQVVDAIKRGASVRAPV
ncbi:MAG: dihydropteroate synthase [Bacteroidota bacterium]